MRTTFDLYISAIYHGTGGPLVVQTPRLKSPVMRAFLKAGEYLGYDIVDPNGSQTTGKHKTKAFHIYMNLVCIFFLIAFPGFSPFQMTINKGIRWSTARAYLRPVAKFRKNLQISLYSHVHRVLFDEEESVEPKRVIGVEYGADGLLHTVYCRKEVILSAGTIGSAKILLLSGIGPSNHLSEIGVSLIKMMTMRTWHKPTKCIFYHLFSILTE